MKKLWFLIVLICSMSYASDQDVIIVPIEEIANNPILQKLHDLPSAAYFKRRVFPLCF